MVQLQHFHNCFEWDVGVPWDLPQMRKIYTFTNTLAATGYERIACTKQGMYHQLKYEVIHWDDLRYKWANEPGETRWIAEGITVYNWSTRYKHIATAPVCNATPSTT